MAALEVSRLNSQVMQKQSHFVIFLSLTGKILWFGMQHVFLKHKAMQSSCLFYVGLFFGVFLQFVLFLFCFWFFAFLGLFKVFFTFRDLDNYGKYFSQRIENSSLGRLQLGLKIQQCWFHMFISQHMRLLDQPKINSVCKNGGNTLY